MISTRAVIASAAKQSIPEYFKTWGWIASLTLAMTRFWFGVRHMKQPAVYIMANRRNGALYTGVTSDLSARVFQHREALVDGFTKRYGCKLLVYYEYYPDMPSAIAREKQIKAGSRSRKIELISTFNPPWRHLYLDLAK